MHGPQRSSSPASGRQIQPVDIAKFPAVQNFETSIADNDAEKPGATTVSMLDISTKQIQSEAEAAAQGRTRLLRDADIPRVAEMFMAVFRRRSAVASALLETHLRQLFLEHPHYDPACGSLVYEGPDGRLTGMLGTLPLRMRLDGQPLDCSILSTWMIENPARDPRPAVALARAHLQRRHAMTMSDTANDTSIEFQAHLRFNFVAGHSLQWVKPLNFLAYATSSIATGIGVNAPRPILAAAHAVEGLARRAVGKRGAPSLAGWHLLEVPPEVFAHGFLDLARAYTLRPDWSIADVVWMLNLIAERRGSGALHLCEARDDAGELAGVCAYFAKRSSRAEVVQIVTRPRAEEGVLRALIAHARSQRCAYICGHASPAIIRGMVRIPKVFYRQTCSTVLRTDAPGLMEAVNSGSGLIGGLVGDSWTPIATESYA